MWAKVITGMRSTSCVFFRGKWETLDFWVAVPWRNLMRVKGLVTPKTIWHHRKMYNACSA